MSPSLILLLLFLVCFLPDEPFVGASVGYFSFLFLLAGRALTVSYLECIHYVSLLCALLYVE